MLRYVHVRDGEFCLTIIGKHVTKKTLQTLVTSLNIDDPNQF